MPVDLHSLWHSQLPLGVECGCGHRGLVDAKAVGAHDGNMKELRTLRLRCTDCRARGDFTPTVFARQEEVDAFLPALSGRTGF